MYKIGTKVSVLNTRYTRNQFSTCTEEIIDLDDVPTNEISLRESAGKMSLSGGQSIVTRRDSLETYAVSIN